MGEQHHVVHRNMLGMQAPVELLNCTRLFQEEVMAVFHLERKGTIGKQIKGRGEKIISFPVSFQGREQWQTSSYASHRKVGIHSAWDTASKGQARRSAWATAPWHKHCIELTHQVLSRRQFNSMAFSGKHQDTLFQEKERGLQQLKGSYYLNAAGGNMKGDI